MLSDHEKINMLNMLFFLERMAKNQNSLTNQVNWYVDVGCINKLKHT